MKAYIKYTEEVEIVDDYKNNPNYLKGFLLIKDANKSTWIPKRFITKEKVNTISVTRDKK